MQKPAAHPKAFQQESLWPQLKDSLVLERRLWREGYAFVAGVDEAGRGAWAGPVVAAAVVFRPEDHIPEIDDSKKLTPQQRERFFDQICERALTYGVGLVDHVAIDRYNILQASILAMQEAVSKLAKSPEYILVDGKYGIGLPIPQKAVVQGDALSQSIGAASILAKVTRDRLMTEIEKQYPQFRFSVHKGYGTALHQQELQQHGASACHRMSFAPLKRLKQYT